MPKLPSNRAAGALDRENLSMPALRLVSAGLSKRAKEKSERAEKSRGRNQFTASLLSGVRKFYPSHTKRNWLKTCCLCSRHFQQKSMVSVQPSAGSRKLMEILRAYRAELDPNNTQRTTLLKHAGAARFAWNWGLARRKQEYEETGKSSNAIEQHRQLNALKKTDFPLLYEVSKAAPQEALRDLDRAYQNFFRRVKNGGEAPGFPKFKSRKNGIGSFRLTGAIHVTETHIKLPRIGWLRLKERGYIPTDGIHILSVTVSEAAGGWFVSVQCKQEIETTQAIGEPVGVDLGIKDLAVISDGTRFENPKPLKKAQGKLRRLQRELSRRKKGGKNREKTRKKIAKAYQRIANIRRDTLHKATSAIVAKTKPDSERPSVVVLEDLNVSGMLANHCLAQAISDVGFAEFRRQLEYKTVW